MQREVGAKKVKAVVLAESMKKPNSCGARNGIYNRISDEIAAPENARCDSFMGESENAGAIADWT